MQVVKSMGWGGGTHTKAVTDDLPNKRETYDGTCVAHVKSTKVTDDIARAELTPEDNIQS